MSDFDVPDEARMRARARARGMCEFYAHALIYVVINVGLFVIDVLTGDG